MALLDALVGLRDPYGCYGGCVQGHRVAVAEREGYGQKYTEDDHMDVCLAARAAVRTAEGGGKT